jgi:hypothetical protein
MIECAIASLKLVLQRDGVIDTASNEESQIVALDGMGWNALPT